MNFLYLLVVFAGVTPLCSGYFQVYAPKTYRVGQDFYFSFIYTGDAAVSSLTVEIKTTYKASGFASLSDSFYTNQIVSGKLYRFKTKGFTLQSGEKVDVNGKYKLTAVLHGSDGRPVSTVSRNLDYNMKVSNQNRVVFIQTDKAIYKPNQIIRGRIFPLKPDLTPTYEKIDINIKFGSTYLAQHKQLSDSNSGVVQFEFPLSDRPRLGEYTIEVFSNSGQETTRKMVTVEKYVVPKFEVLITPPDYVLESQKSFNIVVKGMYTFGKPVRGKLVVKISPQFLAHYSEVTPMIFTVEKFNTESYTIPVQVSDLMSVLKLIGGRTNHLKIDAEITEQFTGIIQNATVPLKISKKEFAVKFLESTPKHYRNGMPLLATLSVTRPDGSPPPTQKSVLLRLIYNVRDTSTYQYQQKVEELYSGLLPVSGIVAVSFSSPANTKQKQVTSSRLEATYNDDRQYTVSHQLEEFKVLGSLSLRVSLLAGENEDSDDKQVRVRLTQRRTVDLSLFARGQLLMVKQVLGSALTPVANMENLFEGLVTVQSVTDLYGPKLTILAAAVESRTGEVVADSLEVAVEDLRNQVTIKVNPQTAELRSEATVTVTATPGSYIGLLGVDKSVLLLKSGNDLDKAGVLAAQGVFDGARKQPNNWWDWPKPMPMQGGLVRGRRSVVWPFWSTGQDTGQMLEEAGIVLITDGTYIATPGSGCPNCKDGAVDMVVMEAAAPDLMFKSSSSSGGSTTTSTKNTVEPRTQFPEAWIWQNFTASADGKLEAKFTVPDTITSWIISSVALHKTAGLGVTDPAKMTAFKNFFVSLNLPYQLVLGERFVLQALVFNYMSSDITCEVDFATSEQYKLSSVNESFANGEPDYRSMTFELKIPSAQNKMAAAVVTPTQLGTIKLRVKATVSGQAAAVDSLEREIKVVPSGIPMERTQAVLLKLNGGEEVVPLEYPPASLRVSGSERLEVSAVGDVLGPALNNLNKLLRTPTGCGEQNMLGFAPNIFVLQYLEAVGQTTPEVKNKAMKNMMTGYQRELNYRRTDGSYSAFGMSDKAGSTWLTSFVLKCFAQSHEFGIVDSKDIGGGSLTFLLMRQNKDGGFSELPESRVCHKNMQGGAAGGVPLTAYVTIALLEVQKVQPSNTAVTLAINKAIARLESLVDGGTLDNKPYALSLIFYALELAKKNGLLVNRNDLVKTKLTALQISENAGEQIHWNVQPKKQDSGKKFYYQVASAGDVEAAGYVLLGASLRSDSTTWCLSILRWLTRQQNDRGGFGSTQDTVVGLQALAQFARTLATTEKPTGEIQFTFRTSKTKVEAVTFGFSDANRVLLRRETVEKGSANVDQVTLQGTGSGMALARVYYAYNVALEPLNQWMEANGLLLKIQEINLNKEFTTLQMIVCGKASEESIGEGMFGMTVNMPSGYEVSEEEKDVVAARYKDNGVKMVEVEGEAVTLYLDSLSTDELCVRISADRQKKVFKQKAKEVKLFNYYESDVVNFVQYSSASFDEVSACTVCDTCPGCSSLDNEVKGGNARGGGGYLATSMATFLAAVVLAFLM